MSIATLFENKDWKTIQWLYENRCKLHGHRYLVHYGCYLKESDKPERIGFFDIETQGSWDADWGVILSYAIKELGQKKILGRSVTTEEILNPKIRDKTLCKELSRDLKQFDTVIVYYGKDAGGRMNRHDFPFSRTRALTHGIDYPKAGELKVIDVYDIIKTKFKLSVRKQATACRQFGIECGTHYATPNIWFSAVQGNKKALVYVWRLHNCEDVVDLENLWLKVGPYKTTRSKI